MTNADPGGPVLSSEEIVLYHPDGTITVRVRDLTPMDEVSRRFMDLLIEFTETT